MDEWSDGQVDGRTGMDRLTDWHTDGRMEGGMDWWMDRGMLDEWMDGVMMDGRMDEERKNGWMYGQRDGWHVTACLVIPSTFNHCLRMCVSFSSHLRGVWCHTRKKRRLDRSWHKTCGCEQSILLQMIDWLENWIKVILNMKGQCIRAVLVFLMYFRLGLYLKNCSDLIVSRRDKEERQEHGGGR